MNPTSQTALPDAAGDANSNGAQRSVTEQRVQRVRPGRNHKSCDACRTRKVRCPGVDGKLPCENCLRRKTECHFSIKKLAHRRNVAEQFLSPFPDVLASGDSPPGVHPNIFPDPSGRAELMSNVLPELLIDRLLSRSSQNSSCSPSLRIRGNGIFGESYSFTFFSEARLQSLSSRLGSQRVNDLMIQMHRNIQNKLKASGSIERPCQARPIPINNLSLLAKARYIQLYFDRVHPFYPFLERNHFEDAISSVDFPQIISHNKAWACLYQTVLALGCQFDNGATFEPGIGQSWELFSVALNSFSELLLQPDSLLALQALASMAVYALGLPCLAIENVITSEAARRAQSLSRIKLAGKAVNLFQRTFWVVYAIEKLSSFHMGRSSVLVDCDISCPVPVIPESIVLGCDWFHSLLRISRIVSRINVALFSVGLSGRPSEYYLETIDRLMGELESWRQSLPDNGVQPAGTKRPLDVQGATERELVVLAHYLYFGVLLALSLVALHHHLPQNRGEVVASPRLGAGSKAIEASRQILELTSLVEVEPYTSIWLLMGIPIAGMFVLFDFVLENPQQEDTMSDLALLDIAGGHFSRLEYRSRGSLPASILCEFARIAREFVNRVQCGSPVANVPERTPRNTQETFQDTPNILHAATSSRALAQEASMDDVPSDFTNEFLEEAFAGIDVLSLFSATLPDLDPIFYQADLHEIGLGSI